MKNVLIISSEQFGYHTISYNYALQLSSCFNVFYLSPFRGKVKIHESKINCIYVKNKNKLGTILRLANVHNRMVKSFNINVTFIKYFTFCSFIKLFNIKHQYIFDIRSAAVTSNYFRNVIYDRILIFESLFFKNITVISEGLAKYLNINKFTVLPLGANLIGDKKSLIKSYDRLNLLYIGTFNYRNLQVIINALALFIKRKNGNIRLTLVGEGNNKEKEILSNAISNNNLKNFVKINKYVSHDKLKNVLSKYNVGISYIPKKPYFEHQPPTKTFEYIFNGLFCIGTNTEENKKIINNLNGILSKEDAESIFESYVYAYESLHRMNSFEISRSLKEYDYKNIVTSKLIPLINGLN